MAVLDSVVLRTHIGIQQVAAKQLPEPTETRCRRVRALFVLPAEEDIAREDVDAHLSSAGLCQHRVAIKQRSRDLFEFWRVGLRQPGRDSAWRLDICAKKRNEGLHGLVVGTPQNDRGRQPGVAFEFSDTQIRYVAVVAGVQTRENAGSSEGGPTPSSRKASRRRRRCSPQAGPAQQGRRPDPQVTQPSIGHLSLGCCRQCMKNDLHSRSR